MLGVILAVVGAVLLLAHGLGLGHLPGDLRFRSGSVRIYVPIATSIVLSVAVTLLLNLFLRR